MSYSYDELAPGYRACGYHLLTPAQDDPVLTLPCGLVCLVVLTLRTDDISIHHELTPATLTGGGYAATHHAKPHTASSQLPLR